LLKIAGSNKDQSSSTFSTDLGFLCHKAGITTEPLHTRSPKAGRGGLLCSIQRTIKCLCRNVRIGIRCPTESWVQLRSDKLCLHN
jgi:hypothetical protein